jgi:hypothetical protein
VKDKREYTRASCVIKPSSPTLPACDSPRCTQRPCNTRRASDS